MAALFALKAPAAAAIPALDGELVQGEMERRATLTQVDQLSAASRSLHAMKYDFDFRIYPETESVEVVEKLRLLQLSFTPNLVLDAGAALQVTEILIGGKAVSFSHPADQLEISLTSEQANSPELDLQFHYTITKPLRGIYFPYDGLELPLQMHTQSEPNDARHWFIGIDRPSDKATFEARIQAPTRWSVLGNGAQVSKVTQGDRTTTHFVLQAPMPTYLFSIVAGEFQVDETKTARGVPVQYWLTKDHVSEGQAALKATPGMIDWISEAIIPYPFEKYATSIAKQKGGAMEHASATTFGESINDGADGDAQSAEGVAIHELVHQWFGDTVTCRSWDDTWLNESFATYVPLLYYRDKEGMDGFYSRLYALRAQYLAAEPKNGALGGIVDYTTPMSVKFAAVAYPKGANILNLLRETMGDAAFFKGLRAYLSTNFMGTAVTADLQHALEGAYGRSLDAFFQQWVYRAGRPAVKFAVSALTDGSFRIAAEQRQPDAIGLYSFPMSVWLSDGSDKMEEHQIWISERTQEVVLKPATGFTAKFALLDPHYAILMERKVEMSPELWMQILASKAITPLRLEALEALATTLTRSQLEILYGNMVENPLVRAAAFRVLGTRFGDSVALFAKAMQDPTKYVRIAAYETLTAVNLATIDVQAVATLVLAQIKQERTRDAFRAGVLTLSSMKLPGAFEGMTGSFDAIHNESHRSYLAMSIAALGDPRVVSFFAKVLPDAIPSLRATLADGLTMGYDKDQAERVLETALFAEPARKGFAFNGHLAARSILNSLAKVHTEPARLAIQKASVSSDFTPDLRDITLKLLASW